MLHYSVKKKLWYRKGHTERAYLKAVERFWRVLEFRKCFKSTLNNLSKTRKNPGGMWTLQILNVVLFLNSYVCVRTHVRCTRTRACACVCVCFVLFFFLHINSLFLLDNTTTLLPLCVTPSNTNTTTTPKDTYPYPQMYFRADVTSFDYGNIVLSLLNY